MKGRTLILAVVLLFLPVIVSASWWNNEWKKCRDIYLVDPLENEINREHEVVELTIEDNNLNKDCSDIRIFDKSCNSVGETVKYVLIDTNHKSCTVRFEVSKQPNEPTTYSVYYGNPRADLPNYLGFDGKPYFVWGDNFNREPLGTEWEIIEQSGTVELQNGYLRLYTSTNGDWGVWANNILRTTKGDFSKSSVNYRFSLGYNGRTNNYLVAQVFSAGASHLYDGDSLHEDQGHCGQIYPFSFVKWVDGVEVKMLDTGVVYNSLDEWHNVERKMVDTTHVNFKVDDSDHGIFEIPATSTWESNSYFYIEAGACVNAPASSELHLDNICIVNENHVCTKSDVGLKILVSGEHKNIISHLPDKAEPILCQILPKGLLKSAGWEKYCN